MTPLHVPRAIFCTEGLQTSAGPGFFQDALLSSTVIQVPVAHEGAACTAALHGRRWTQGQFEVHRDPAANAFKHVELEVGRVCMQATISPESLLPLNPNFEGEKASLMTRSLHSEGTKSQESVSIFSLTGRWQTGPVQLILPLTAPGVFLRHLKSSHLQTSSCPPPPGFLPTMKN